MELEYEHECSRAELLGLSKPTMDEFLASRSRVEKSDDDPDGENVEISTAEEAENEATRREEYGRIRGGLDELNSILTNTQKKLNRLRSICGSFGNVVKTHLSPRKQSNDSVSNASAEFNEKSVNDNNIQEPTFDGAVNETEKRMDSFANKKDKGDPLDKLDSLISKAERAELSLSSQNKQMKKFLN